MEEVRLAAAKRLGEDPSLVREIVDVYAGRSSRQYSDAIMCLASTNPTVVKHLVSGLLMTAPAELVVRDRISGRERQGKLFCLCTYFIKPVMELGALLSVATHELRAVLSTLRDIHSEAGGWKLPVHEVDSGSGQMLFSAAAGAPDMLPAGHTGPVTELVFDIESLKNDVLGLLRALNSQEAASLLNEFRDLE